MLDSRNVRPRLPVGMEAISGQIEILNFLTFTKYASAKKEEKEDSSSQNCADSVRADRKAAGPVIDLAR
jgi:hypothetical protein